MRRLGRSDRDRIERSVNRLPDGDVRPLVGLPNAWRLRVGDWRILFEMFENERRIKVTDVRPRSSAYKP